MHNYTNLAHSPTFVQRMLQADKFTIMECKVCKKNKELRMEVCFDCADAESIIAEGLDMWDKGKNGKEEPAKTAMDKLQLLIEKGWIHSLF